MANQKCPTEHEEQCYYFAWLEENYPRVNELTFAIPNGAHKSPAMAAKFKREGLKRGVPDIFLAVPNDFYSGLFIEMKRQRGGCLSEAQSGWVEMLSYVGYKVEVCKGFKHARDVTLRYITMESRDEEGQDER